MDQFRVLRGLRSVGVRIEWVSRQIEIKLSTLVPAQSGRRLDKHNRERVNGEVSGDSGKSCGSMPLYLPERCS